MYQAISWAADGIFQAEYFARVINYINCNTFN